jgi:hypothetical protein
MPTAISAHPQMIYNQVLVHAPFWTEVTPYELAFAAAAVDKTHDTGHRAT